jgi:hypothetical protein
MIGYFLSNASLINDYSTLSDKANSGIVSAYLSDNVVIQISSNTLTIAEAVVGRYFLSKSILCSPGISII